MNHAQNRNMFYESQFWFPVDFKAREIFDDDADDLWVQVVYHVPCFTWTFADNPTGTFRHVFFFKISKTVCVCVWLRPDLMLCSGFIWHVFNNLAGLESFEDSLDLRP